MFFGWESIGSRAFEYTRFCTMPGLAPLGLKRVTVTTYGLLRYLFEDTSNCTSMASNPVGRRSAAVSLSAPALTPVEAAASCSWVAPGVNCRYCMGTEGGPGIVELSTPVPLNTTEPFCWLDASMRASAWLAAAWYPAFTFAAVTNARVC